MLTVSLDNIKIGDDPTSKAFVTGLTFGLAGTAVTDGYVCTLTYLAPGKSTPVISEVAARAPAMTKARIAVIELCTVFIVFVFRLFVVLVSRRNGLGQTTRRFYK